MLRSKTPELVRQEFWGLLLAHFAIRDLMQEAAHKGQQDPDQFSYVHAVRLVPPQTGDRGGPSPLGLEKRFTSRCSTNCSRSGWSPLAATAARAASSAR